MLASVVPGEIQADRARLLMSEALRLGITAPAHWPLEVGNALLSQQLRGRLTEDQRREIMPCLAALPVAIDPATVSKAWHTAIALAQLHRLTLYDAAYLELALRKSVPLASFDDALRRAAGTRNRAAARSARVTPSARIAAAIELLELVPRRPPPGRRGRQRLLPQPPLHRLRRSPGGVRPGMASAAHAAPPGLVAGTHRGVADASPAGGRQPAAGGMDAGGPATELCRRPVRPAAAQPGRTAAVAADGRPAAGPSGHAGGGAAGDTRLAAAAPALPLRPGPAPPKWRRWANPRRSICG